MLSFSKSRLEDQKKNVNLEMQITQTNLPVNSTHIS